MAVPKVNSALLAEAVESAGPNISGFTSTLDDLSQDIRKLEKMLQDSGFRLSVITKIGDYEAVAWTDLNKRWRIYYREWEFHPDYPDAFGRWHHRPLIETPVEIRLRAVEPLAELIREIGSRIPKRVPLPHQLALALK